MVKFGFLRRLNWRYVSILPNDQIFFIVARRNQNSCSVLSCIDGFLDCVVRSSFFTHVKDVSLFLSWPFDPILHGLNKFEFIGLVINILDTKFTTLIHLLILYVKYPWGSFMVVNLWNRLVFGFIFNVGYPFIILYLFG